MKSGMSPEREDQHRSEAGGEAARRASLPGPADHLDSWEELAVDYLAVDLDQPARQAVEDHLAGCATCRNELALHTALVAAARDLPLSPAPPDLESRVFAGLEEQGAFRPASAKAATKEAERRESSRESSFFRRIFARPARAAWIPAVAALILVAVALSQVGDDLRLGGDEAAVERTMSGASDTSTSGVGTMEFSDSRQSIPEGPPGTPEEDSGGTLTTAAGAGTESTASTGAPLQGLDEPGEPGAAEARVVGLRVSPTSAGELPLAPEGPAVAPALPLLPSDRWLGAPTAAAYLRRADLPLLERELSAAGAAWERRRSMEAGEAVAGLAASQVPLPTLFFAADGRIQAGPPSTGSPEEILVIFVAEGPG